MSGQPGPVFPEAELQSAQEGIDSMNSSLLAGMCFTLSFFRIATVLQSENLESVFSLAN